MSDNFGEWTNLQERIEELRNRIAAWYVCGASIRDMFQTAGERFERELRQQPNPLELRADQLLRIFEDILDAHDNILEIAPFERPDREGGE